MSDQVRLLVLLLDLIYLLLLGVEFTECTFDIVDDGFFVESFLFDEVESLSELFVYIL